MRETLTRLDGMGADELRTMAQDARTVADAAPALREVLDPVAQAAEARLDSRGTGDVRLPEHLDAPPEDVIVDQREAMARAIVLRDDESRPSAERAVWGDVVERLAKARRVAKDAMAERRRSDPSLQSFDELIASRQAAERADADLDDLHVRDDPGEEPGLASGRAEPAPWQAGPEYLGEGSQHGGTPDTSLTDRLVAGTGMAGGTGGAGSQNLPADTGLAPESPERPRGDPGPPDVGSR